MKYLNDQNTHKATNETLYKRLNTVEKHLYEVELLKSTLERWEPIIVGFFILPYAKLRILKLYYNFFDKIRGVSSFKKLKMNTDLLRLALAEKKFVSLNPTR